MSRDYAAWADKVRRLHHALDRLRAPGESVGVAPPEGREWFELLAHKLLPQVSSEPYLIVAVVGGTNIGKSVIFNHLAGEVASAVSPLASGTRQPVCLAPENFADPPLLSRLFEGFELRAWSAPEDALREDDRHLLFWRLGKNVPQRLLLLDTPDIDSDAPVNWQRADHIRQSADVLVAVLTQQKYNDAAVKQFFRKAAEADKPVIVLFNQCDLVEDREYWPRWLETFVDQTGVHAELVYVAPHDRAAAKDLNLAFYSVGADGRQPIGAPTLLREELASLHFDTIKLRTLRGALRKVLDKDLGAPAWLDEFHQAGERFSAAAAALSACNLARVQWPALPARLLVAEVQSWWDERRSTWSRRVHGAYRWIGDKVATPFRAAWQYVQGPSDPLENFRRDERTAVITAVEQLLHELQRLADVGNDTLKPRLQKLMGGRSRADLLARVQASHDQLPPVDEDFQAYLRGELDNWAAANPRVTGLVSLLDQSAAVARPALTITLAVSGWFVAGGLVHEVAAQALGHTLSHVAADTAIVVGGEAGMSTAGAGLKHAMAQLFRKLQSRFAQQRAAWLAGWLERELLGDLLRELRAGSEIVRHPDVAEANALLQDLTTLWQDSGKP